jgi:multimeric flavodoxin WrbA
LKVLGISASNVHHKRDESTSTRVVRMALKLLTMMMEAQVESIHLLDYDLQPCIFCGHCLETGNCTRDPAFNRLHSKILESDAIILVCPHYSVIPAKLTMAMEKMNQIYYTASIADSHSHSPYQDKKVGLIAHGGGDESSYQQYQEMILKPLGYLFKSLKFDLVSLGERNGVVFGVRGFEETDTSIFPDMVHDWDEVENAIMPLIRRMSEVLTSQEL